MHVVGTLTLKSRWVLDAKPHVLMRAKRLFAGSFDRERAVQVSDTEENAVDLLWFMERFPLSMSDADKKHLKAQAKRAEERINATETLLKQCTPVTLKCALKKPLYSYQNNAVAFWRINSRFLCADDLGLGKTIQAIASISDGLQPAVCVVPNHIQRQWKAKFSEFAPHLNVHIARSGAPYPLPNFRDGVEYRGKKLVGYPCNVLILNYQKLAGWAPFLSKWARAIVYDEIHHLARNKTQKSDAAAILAETVPNIQGMSNTPIRNYGGEMFNVYSALGCRAHLGTREEFYREWCSHTMGTAGSEPLLKNPEAFVAWLKENGLMLRRTAAEAGVKIHEPEIIPHEVDCDAAPLKDVENATEELARIVLGEVQSKNFDKMRAANELDWQLRQATGIAKAPYVAEFVRMLVESGEKVVVGLWHREVYNILQNRLRDLGVAIYSGTESNTQKERAKELFCRDGTNVVHAGTNVFLLSLRSGEGLDGIQYASRVAVFAELDWTHNAHLQFTGRLARTGQARQVLAYFLHTLEGSDPVVMERVGLKRDQHERLINPDKKRSVIQVDPGHIKALAKRWLEGRRAMKRTALPTPGRN